MRTKWEDLVEWWADPTNQLLVGVLGAIAFLMSLLGAVCAEESWTPRMDPTLATVCVIGLMLIIAAATSLLWQYHKIRPILAQTSLVLAAASIAQVVQAF